MARTSTSPGKAVRKTAEHTAAKVVKLAARRALRSGARAIRSLADRAAATGSEVIEAGTSKRLPIQVGIDVAVPLRVAWKEWMASSSLTEGVHRIEDIERDGDRMFGVVDGPREREWSAEIVDEREEESFAWRSLEGTDCAGLVTFHRLSDRLTRIELDLDVLPTGPAEMLALSLHLAHRHAEADLRRFKAHVEFINPDVYKADMESNGDKPTQKPERRKKASAGA
jgi:uncharacterized membrane protein